MSEKNKIKVKPILETLEYIHEHNCSVVRFGDGEVDVICGHSIAYQPYNETLANRLLEILKTPSNENLMVCLPDVFENVERYNGSARSFWEKHFDIYQDFYDENCQSEWYGSTFLSRPYIDLQDKSQSAQYFEAIKGLWQDRDILIVEGETTQSGVGNDLFDGAKSVKRIIGPSKNAFHLYDQLLETIHREADGRLILLMLGPTAKPLVVDLAARGHQAIDLGHIDSEYEWFKLGATHKVKLNHKHTAEFNQDRDIQLQYDQAYLDSVVAWVGVKDKSDSLKKKDLISVIVPVYNVEGYLHRCLDSLLNQTYQDLEIILINDGSTDKSAMICEEYGMKSDKIHVYHQKNQGVSAARNFGMELATGEYLSFVDSDDFLDDRYFEILHHHLTKTGSDISSVSFTSYDEDKRVYMFFHNENNYFEKVYSVQEWIDAEASWRHNLHLTVLFSPLKLYKRHLFDGIKFPVGRLREDDATIYKVYLRANQIAYSHEGPYFYSQRSEGLSRTTMLDDIDTMISNSEERIALMNLLGYDTSAQLSSYIGRLEKCADDALNTGRMAIYYDIKLKLDLYKNFKKER